MLTSKFDVLPVVLRTEDLSFLMAGLPDLVRSVYLRQAFGVASHARIKGPQSGGVLEETLQYKHGESLITAEVESVDKGLALIQFLQTCRNPHLNNTDPLENYTLRVNGFVLQFEPLGSEYIILHDCNLYKQLVGVMQQGMGVGSDLNGSPVHEKLIYALTGVSLGYIKGIATSLHTAPAASGLAWPYKQLPAFVGQGFRFSLDAIAEAIRKGGGHDYRDALYAPVTITTPGGEPVRYNMLHPGFLNVVARLAERYALSQGFSPEQAKQVERGQGLQPVLIEPVELPADHIFSNIQKQFALPDREP